MESRRPSHVLPEEVLVQRRYRDRPVVVCGPPCAPGATGTAADEVVVDGDGADADAPVSAFFRGSTTPRLDGDASEWRLYTPGDRLDWGVRDGWVGFTTDQSFLGGPDRPEDVIDLVETVIDAILLVERGRFGAV